MLNIVVVCHNLEASLLGAGMGKIHTYHKTEEGHLVQVPAINSILLLASLHPATYSLN